MAKRKPFQFDKHDSHMVRVLQNDQSDTGLAGKLIFEAGKFPRLEIDSNDLHYTERQRICDSLGPDIECKSSDYNFRLHGCDLDRDTVFPRYVSTLEHSQKIVGVEVLLSEVTSIMSRPTFLEIDEKKLSRNRRPIKIDTIAELRGQPIQISSRYYASSKTIDENSFQIDEAVNLRVAILEGEMSVSQCEDICHDLRRLFSLLLLMPIDIKDAWILVGDKHDRIPFYFVNTLSGFSRRSDRDRLIWHAPQDQEDFWESILRNYFSSNQDKFNKTWQKLPMLFNYPGPWQHRLFSIIAILDSLSKDFAKKSQKKLTTKLFGQIKKEINDLLDAKEDAINKPEHKMVLKSIRDQINTGLKNSNLSTFSGYYGYLLENTNTRFVKALQISDSDFKHLKRIRDAVAHGKPTAFDDKYNITREYTLSNKILVLLIYHAYRDLGIEAKSLAQFLSSTINAVALNARLNDFELHMLAGTRQTFTVNKKNLLKAYRLIRAFPIVGCVDNSGTLVINERLTNIPRDETKKSRNISEDVQDALPETFVGETSWIGNAYLLCDDAYLQVSSLVTVIEESEDKIKL